MLVYWQMSKSKKLTLYVNDEISLPDGFDEKQEAMEHRITKHS